MISKKIFTNADGNVTRFLSDFIIRSQDFARPYVYIYDNTLDPGGTEDQLQDGSTDQADWVWPDNIWKRGSDLAQSDDIVTVDKWQVVDNSVLFFIAPSVNTTIWLEVATTAEEFGDTLTQASVLAAENSASAAAGYADDAETSAIASANSAAEAGNKLPKDGSEPMTGNLEAPSMSIGGVTINVDTYGITYGSNANGNWVKFPDGTLICSAKVSGTFTTTGARGSIFSVAITFLNYPVAFVEIYSVSLGNVSEANYAIGAGPLFQSTLLTPNSAEYYGTSTSSQIIDPTYTAIGRWK